MPTKITIIYDNPIDPDAFEAGYGDGQVELAMNLPGVQRIESYRPEAVRPWPR